MADSGDIPAKVYFCATACGGEICSATILQGKGGLSTKYSAESFKLLASQHRTAYVTRAFKEQHASLTVLMRWGAQQKWWAAVAQGNVQRQSLCLVAEEGDAESNLLKRKSKYCLTKKMYMDLLLRRCVRAVSRVQAVS